jgi:hypothetical protein
MEWVGWRRHVFLAAGSTHYSRAVLITQRRWSGSRCVGRGSLSGKAIAGDAARILGLRIDGRLRLMMRPTICASRFAILLILVLPAYAQTQTSEDTEKSKQSPSTSSGVFRVGGSVSPPRVTYGPDPEYSDEARKAKYQGVCVRG